MSHSRWRNPLLCTPEKLKRKHGQKSLRFPTYSFFRNNRIEKVAYADEGCADLSMDYDTYKYQAEYNYLKSIFTGKIEKYQPNEKRVLIPFIDHAVLLKRGREVWVCYAPYFNHLSREEIAEAFDTFERENGVKAWIYGREYSWYGYGTHLVIVGRHELKVEKYSIEEASERCGVEEFDSHTVYIDTKNVGVPEMHTSYQFHKGALYNSEAEAGLCVYIARNVLTMAEAAYLIKGRKASPIRKDFNKAIKALQCLTDSMICEIEKNHKSGFEYADDLLYPERCLDSSAFERVQGLIEMLLHENLKHLERKYPNETEAEK